MVSHKLRNNEIICTGRSTFSPDSVTSLTFFSGLAGPIHGTVDLLLIAQDEWPDKSVVDDLGAIVGRRSHTPDKEDTLKTERPSSNGWKTKRPKQTGHTNAQGENQGYQSVIIPLWLNAQCFQRSMQFCCNDKQYLLLR